MTCNQIGENITVMVLSEYLRKHDLSYAAFGERIGVKAQTVWRYANAERVPTPKVMRRIIEETDGAIGPGDFFGEAA